MRSPAYLALLSFCLLSFLPACAQEEPLLEAKSSLGTVSEPLFVLCLNGMACTSTKGSCSGTGTCNSSGTCVVSSWCNDNNVCTSDSCTGFGSVWYCSNTATSAFVGCSDGSACTTGDHCNGAGTCIGGPTVDCADTNPCTNDSCLPASGCTHTNTSSGTSCTDNNACTSGDVCNGYGSCVGSTVVCNDGNSCTTDTCNSGTGCVYTFIGTNWSCNDNNLCTTNDRCNASQQCLGTAVVPDDDGNVCTQDVCIPATGYTAHNPLTGRTCNDGNACTVGDSCSNGACTNSTPLNCNDGNACTTDSCNTSTGCVNTAIVCNHNNPCIEDTCLPASGCSFSYSATSKTCSDGDLCTNADHCNGTGSCIGTAVVPENDNNPCTLDTCNPAAPGTLHTPTNQGLACDDNNACTTTSSCNNGICVGGASLNCDDGNVCTTDFCNISSGCAHGNAAATVPCNDNDACTGSDHCSGSGTCTGYTNPPIDDYNACTQDICNSATGITSHQPVANGTSCNDNKVCTEPDTCTDGTCGGATRNCSDNDACTTDSCDASSGCVHTAIVCNDNIQCTSDSCSPVYGCVYTVLTGASCNDGNACTTGETCNSSKVCGQGTPVVPQNDNNFCTLDLCVPATGLTSHTPTNQGLACDDGNACSVTSACAAGVCQGVSWLNCNDSNICTDDSCDPATGCSPPVYNTVACNDNNGCTLDDHCSAGTCTGTNVSVPLDFNPCTNDICNPVTGAIEHPNYPNGTACNDGKLCTTNDSCQAGLCGGTATLCPGDKCTNYQCDETSGLCVFQNNVVCNDNDPCTDDGCDPSSGCTKLPKNCSDTDECTVDSCSSSGVCQHEPKNCSGTDACKVYGCNKQTGCTEAPRDIDDHNSCTTDVCNPWAGPANEYIGDGKPCDDGNATTQEDFCGEFKCNAGLSCQPAVLTSLPQPVPPPIVRRRLGRGRHVVATSDKGQAVVFVEELTEKGGSINVGVATFTASGVRTGVVKFGKVPFYADPVIAALPSGDYVVAFDSVTLDGDGLAVGLVKVSSDGQLLKQPVLANTTKAFGQHSADIIWTGTELRMAWEDESEPGHRRLCQRRFNENLSPLSGEECGASAPEYDRSHVSLTTVGQAPVTAWQETWQETFEPFNTRRRLQLRIGTAQTSFDITAAPQDESPAVVELDASHVLMVYPDTDGTQRAVVVDDAGNVEDIAALNEAGEPRYTPVLTKIGEQVYMAWMSPPALLDGGWDPDLDDVFVQRLAWNQGMLDLNANAKFPIPFSESYRFGDQRNPAIAPRLFNGKNAMWTAWEDFRDDKTQTNHGDVLVSIRALP